MTCKHHRVSANRVCRVFGCVCVAKLTNRRLVSGWSASHSEQPNTFVNTLCVHTVLLADKETRKATSIITEQRQKLWKTKAEIELMYGPEAPDVMEHKKRTKGMARKDPNCPKHLQYAVFVDENMARSPTECLSCAKSLLPKRMLHPDLIQHDGSRNAVLAVPAGPVRASTALREATCWIGSGCSIRLGSTLPAR